MPTPRPGHYQGFELSEEHLIGFLCSARGLDAVRQGPQTSPVARQEPVQQRCMRINMQKAAPSFWIVRALQRLFRLSLPGLGMRGHASRA